MNVEYATKARICMRIDSSLVKARKAKSRKYMPHAAMIRRRRLSLRRMSMKNMPKAKANHPV